MKIKNSAPNDKTTRLTKLERSQIVLPNNLKDISIGLLLGDLYAQKQTKNSNAMFRFEQGLVHKDYLFHLYELFKSYSGQAPKISKRLPNNLTGVIYTRVTFFTYALPCLTEIHALFYVNGKKRLPPNIVELLTSLGLCYWICDDGGFNNVQGSLILNTQSFTKEEVELLAKTLNGKWDLNCTINKKGPHFVIRIPSKSLPILQNLLKDIIPPMMKRVGHKVMAPYGGHDWRPTPPQQRVRATTIVLKHDPALRGVYKSPIYGIK